MSFIYEIMENIIGRIGHDVGSLTEIISVLLMIFLFSIYEFFIYRFVSRKSIYNKSFHISTMILPFFIGSIVMALQSNLVITLGTIGALAIIRYRTAIKDPVDMIYILWSIFIGISCGCQLYELCILTSIAVTLTLLAVNGMFRIMKSHNIVLVVNSDLDNEHDLEEALKQISKKYRLKSMNVSENGFDYIFSIETQKKDQLSNIINSVKGIKRYSILEYENEDII